MNYWLVKSEPFKNAWERFEQDGQTFWDGVRNYQARNNLMAMKPGDICIFYRSVHKPAAVGLATVTQTAVPDTTVEPDDPKGDWFCTEVGFLEKFIHEVSLKQIKAEPALLNMVLFKQSRLSVQPVEQDAFELLVRMGRG
jgi:predicted RNA-binding protein with PUA-like domain